jgi:multidrug efflux pump subunit AcrA (membrane-fusion protein)
MKRTIERAISIAEQVAQRMETDAADAAADAVRAALYARANEAGGAYVPHLAGDFVAEAAVDTARSAADAAQAAAYAARAAADAEIAAKAADTAARADEAGFLRQTLEAIAHDFELLRARVADGTLKEDTPVPPSFFGPLWPEGSPPWSSEQDEIVLEIDVPDTATEEEVLAGIEEVVDAADRLHRAEGGHGLKVEALEVTEEAGVPAEVLS